MAQGSSLNCPNNQLPVPANATLCTRSLRTLAGGVRHPASRALGRENLLEIGQTLAKQGLEGKLWLLSIPRGLGGAEVRKSNQEREQRKYKGKKKKGETG